MTPPKTKPLKSAQTSLAEASASPPTDASTAPPFPSGEPAWKQQAWVLRDWWRKSQKDNKGGVAKLKRLDDPLHAASLSVYQDLLRRLKDHNLSPSEAELPRWEALAALAAHAKKESNTSMPRALGAKREGSDAALMSELRFRRILAVADDDIEGLFQNLRRAIDQLDKTSHFESLTQAVLRWNANTRRAWSYDYYGASMTSQDNDQPSNP